MELGCTRSTKNQSQKLGCSWELVVHDCIRPTNISHHWTELLRLSPWLSVGKLAENKQKPPLMGTQTHCLQTEWEINTDKNIGGLLDLMWVFSLPYYFYFCNKFWDYYHQLRPRIWDERRQRNCSDKQRNKYNKARQQDCRALALCHEFIDEWIHMDFIFVTFSFLST